MFVKENGTLLSGILLISGTCMGAGMLAIPMVTGLAGFFPAMLVNILCYLFMMATGLLFLEATLWMPDGANVLSMAGRFLGAPGKLLGGLFFLFLYYCLMVSYIAGGAPLFSTAVNLTTDLALSHPVSLTLFTLLFGAAVYYGTRFVDRLNGILMFGLILSYLLLVGVGIPEVNSELLLHKKWGLSLFAAPILFSAYGYHNIIPTLSTYLRRNRQQLRKAVIWGTTLPFVVYSVWQWLIIGVVPLEELTAAASEGFPVSVLLYSATQSKWIGSFALFFSFFGLITSVLGVALSMVDFLGDGLSMSRKGMHRFFLTLLVFLPPALFAAYYPNIFAEALGVAGGFGEGFLNGLLPIAMVWVGRYQWKLEGIPLLRGGKGLLLLLAFFALFIFALEIAHLTF